jgi:hypothetical protein
VVTSSSLRRALPCLELLLLLLPLLLLHWWW